MATASTSASVSPAAWFRIAALIALVWNGFGVSMYLSAVGMFGDPTAGMNEAERQAAESIPGWIMGAFATGTFAGLIGSLGLLLSKRWAQPVLLISAAALLVLEGWVLFFSGMVEQFGIGIPLTVAAGALLLAWLATHARFRGWLS